MLIHDRTKLRLGHLPELTLLAEEPRVSTSGAGRFFGVSIPERPLASVFVNGIHNRYPTGFDTTGTSHQLKHGLHLKKIIDAQDFLKDAGITSYDEMPSDLAIADALASLLREVTNCEGRPSRAHITNIQLHAPETLKHRNMQEFDITQYRASIYASLYA